MPTPQQLTRSEACALLQLFYSWGQDLQDPRCVDILGSPLYITVHAHTAHLPCTSFSDALLSVLYRRARYIDDDVRRQQAALCRMLAASDLDLARLRPMKHYRHCGRVRTSLHRTLIDSSGRLRALDGGGPHDAMILVSGGLRHGG